VSESQSDPQPAEEQPATERDARAEAAARRIADLVGSDEWTAEFGTAKVKVPRDGWVAAHEAVKPDMPFFSWLAGVDWSREVAVGEPPEDETVEERFEVMSRLADVTAGDAVILSTDVPKDDPSLATLVPVYGGADWHERETAEMFGIDFVGHPNPVKLYLPDGFEGHPLRKSYPLLSREVKPWPGTVDVEDMPSTDNVEAGEGGEE
jgi:NADH-quinone oxidoreductase subunit C